MELLRRRERRSCGTLLAGVFSLLFFSGFFSLCLVLLPIMKHFIPFPFFLELSNVESGLSQLHCRIRSTWCLLIPAHFTSRLKGKDLKTQMPEQVVGKKKHTHIAKTIECQRNKNMPLSRKIKPSYIEHDFPQSLISHYNKINNNTTQPLSPSSRSRPIIKPSNLTTTTTNTSCPSTPNPHNFAPSFLFTHLLTASTPALATSSSCPGVPVLTPIAPTTLPSTSIGNPPPITQNLPPLLLKIPKPGPPGRKFFAAGPVV